MRELFASALLCLLTGLFLPGCRDTALEAFETEKGIKSIVYQLQLQFGSKGKYSNIHFRNDGSSGLVLTITGLAEGNPDSLVVRQLKNTSWVQLNAIPIKELHEGLYFFTLDSLSDMKILPGLIRSTMNKMTKDMPESGVKINEVIITGQIYEPTDEPLRYNIYVQPKDVYDKFEFSYNLKGQLKSVQDY
ncbi:MAG TPA: hypothetical protein VM488_01670 [Pseudobacter sp.]|nr:hypothetical protein [Pseudobacter sp.]